MRVKIETPLARLSDTRQIAFAPEVAQDQPVSDTIGQYLEGLDKIGNDISRLLSIFFELEIETIESRILLRKFIFYLEVPDQGMEINHLKTVANEIVNTLFRRGILASEIVFY